MTQEEVNPRRAERDDLDRREIVRRAPGDGKPEVQVTGDRGLGKQKVEASRGPRRNVRPFEHPCYWVAFILIGDPGMNPSMAPSFLVRVFAILP